MAEQPGWPEINWILFGFIAMVIVLCFWIDRTEKRVEALEGFHVEQEQDE